ncbi:MAG: sigma-70 family RNA polymerase sigma factor [Gammaproteobacteria bacterium]|nr:sigma-70 family RNA polymerase sigma factor [Gammaproteobacteria bacterium]
MIDKELMQRLFAYAMVLCRHRDDALDLLQSCLESCLGSIRKHKTDVKDPEAFVRASIRNRFIDGFHGRARWQNEPYEEGGVYDISPLDIEHITIQQHELSIIWEQLEVRDRDILYHWAVLGYSTDEVCEKLGLARGTLLSRLHRLRQKFAPSDAANMEQHVS